MSARFRIRTPTGQELSFASLDVFREFVRSGDLSPDDVVYDAETKEWSSARTHPVVLEIELDHAESASAEAEATDLPEDPTPSTFETDAAEAAHSQDAPAFVDPDPAFHMGDIGLDLAPEPSPLTPDQEAAAFLARMEAERATDLTLDENVPIQSFTSERSHETRETSPVPAAAPPPSEIVPRSFRQERMSSAPARAVPAAAEAKPSEAWKYAPFVILVLALAGAGVYFGPDFFSPAPTAGSDAAADTPPQPPPAAGSIPATNDALRGRANERFLASTQALMRRLEPIPQTWLSGRYLAAASDFEHVRQIWDDYLVTIREIRSGDEERYRAAYLRALEDAGVQEPARATRLAAGMAEFQRTAVARARHYDRVEMLATVAISGHAELVAAEGRILYEPVTGPRVSNDPVIEAVGRTPADQALLEEILDAILGQLQGPGGAGSAPNVREWAYGGLLDAVTN